MNSVKAKMKDKGGFLVAIALAVFMTGCQWVNPSSAFVGASRKAHDAVAPEYLRYVEADTSLDDDDKDIRRETIKAWDRAIEEAEKANKKPE